MRRARKSPQQRRDDAMAKTESATIDLLMVAQRIADNERAENDTLWSKQNRRIDLLKAARRYTRAMDALTRVRQ